MVLIFQTNWQHLMTLNAQGFLFVFFSFLEGGCPEGAYEKVLGGPSSTFQLPVVD